MKARAVAFLAVCTLISALQASTNLDRAHQLERSGDAVGARLLLAKAAQDPGADITALAEYAEFLDHFDDPDCRQAYQKLLNILEKSGDPAKRQAVAHRLVLLDLLAGDHAAAERHAEAYRAAGGKELLLTSPAKKAPAEGKAYIAIPGPLRSFARMAAISTDNSMEDLLASLARNVVTNGYQASHSNEALEQTEYLKLVHRYLTQARELEKLAGPEKVIKIESCDSPKAGDLLRILGYRMRGGCGSEVVLETVNASRAFLTTDSGFPLPDLEQALRTNRPFTYDFHPVQVPVLFGAEYWLSSREKEGGEFIDIFLSDPALCRLYLGLSKLDRGTADTLRKSIAVQRIRAYAHVLDFFGGMFQIRNGKAVIPGGARATTAWADLVGVSPDNGPLFFERLIARDDGWMASYFDALSRIQGPTLAYLTDPTRLKRFYGAVRGKVTSPGPARPVFRSNADMMLLTTRLQIDPDGKVHIPGSLEVWRNLFVNHPHGKYDGKLTKSAAGWKEPDEVVEALFGLSRKAVENEPLKIFMALTDLDRNRPTPLAPETVDRLARAYRQFGSQFPIFNEAPTLSDKSIMLFLDTAESINKMKEPLLRSDTAGTMQALVGLWQIVVRQRSLPLAQADGTFSDIVGRFAQIKNNRELFDAGRDGVKALLVATGGKAAQPQERLLDLLAGVSEASDVDSYTQVVQEMTRVLEAQRILSLDTLFDLADHLQAVANGEKPNLALLNRVSTRINEIQLPRASLSSIERNALAFGYWTERHVESQRRVNLRALIEKNTDKQKLADSRGLLAPFLRDTLVAYNYAHYAPPGAQILYTNPLFVRSHDFLGVQGTVHTWRTTELFGTGWPSNGGGRLVGSLAGLPYALAEAEQNFLVPRQTQALIWGDLVPQMMLSATVPRWWRVTPAQMHWVALHMRYTQSLVASAALDAELRQSLHDALATQASPARTMRIMGLVADGDVKGAVESITPSEMFAIARLMAAKETTTPGPMLAEMRRLASEMPEEVNYRAISEAFGTPKPTLANSYRPELLSLRTFPTLMGYSSRIMAESWESNTLYWATLADEMHVPPSQLNVRIPEWTERLVERIFASHLEDWPAVLRSLRLVGDDVRAKARTPMSAEQKASLQ